MRYFICTLSLLTVIGCDNNVQQSRHSTPPLPTQSLNDLHEDGRPAKWQATFIDLGDSGYRAAVGPVIYQDTPDKDPDYYSIDIERPDGDVSHVLFTRDFPIETIDPKMVNAEARDIVRYEKDTRTVIFTVAGEEVSYVLPNAP